MEIKVKQVTYLVFTRPNTKRAPTEKLHLAEDVVLNYSKFAVRNYTVTFIKNNSAKNILVKIGCKTASLQSVNGAVAFLQGINSTKLIKVLVNKKHSDSRHLKQKVVEESENFFITDRDKVYPKTTHEIREIEIDTNVLKVTNTWGNPLSKAQIEDGQETWLSYNNGTICKNTKTNRDNLLKDLLFIQSVLRSVKDYCIKNKIA